ncbi:MAG: hypothetical protein CM15mP74_15890 [Halieaceae bacterium]|nr:MAG: hypothetical protein CM15mP74_15890 [Halieaceae bacterium]
MTYCAAIPPHAPPMATRALLIFYGCNTAVMADELPDPVAATWRGEPVCETLSETAEMRCFAAFFHPVWVTSATFTPDTLATPSRAAGCALQMLPVPGR